MSCISAQAAVLNVPSQHATIQLAIAAALAGDTVLVAANATYAENIDFLGKDITVKTPNPAADRLTTVIDGGGNGTVVSFKNNESNLARLQGFTIQNGTGTMHDCWYYLSLVKLSGGGILCDSPYSYDHTASSYGSSPTLSYLIIQNNSAEMGGGLCAWLRSYPVIENTIVRNNTASGSGGGLYFIEAFNAAGPAITITNVEVTHNTGGINGGSGIGVNYTSKANLMNCTVSDNAAANISGEALWRANGSFYEIYNSIFWNLNADLIYDDGGWAATSTIDYCDVTNQAGDLVAGSNMLSTDPMFLNPGGNDYHLSSLSPCIDAGTAAGAPLTDLDGNMRNAIPDMGAYENTSVGMQELAGEGISVFPNPAQDEISIMNTGRLSAIKLFDATGRLINDILIHPFENKKMDLTGLGSGCYFISVDGVSFQKIVKM
jgi:hypothetical protein